MLRKAGSAAARVCARATGNIVTEDLVFLLESMGMDTGIDIGKLIAARAVLAEGIAGSRSTGTCRMQGVTKGFGMRVGGLMFRNATS